MTDSSESVEKFSNETSALGRDDDASLSGVSRVTSRVNRDVYHEEARDEKKPRRVKIYEEIYNFVYPKLILNHLNWPDLKIILRSWIMMWCLTLLCIIHAPMQFMGPSSFLANFSAGIEISGNLSVSAAFVYCMTDLFTLMLAFLTSVVTMAINWRIRGYVSEEMLLSQVLAEGLCSDLETPTFESCIMPLAHRGHFLRTKSTTVTIFGMLFSFSMCGYIQQKFKYARLAWLLDSLYTIMVFTFNNFIPVFKPWYYARNAVVPMSMAFAFRFGVSLLFFPFSSTNRVVENLSKACFNLGKIVHKMESKVQEVKPSMCDLADEFGFLKSEAQQTFTKLIVNDVDMEILNKCEFWFSRFTKHEICDLRSQVRLVMSAISSFHFFFESTHDHKLDILTGEQQTVRKKAFKSDTLRHNKHMPEFIKKKLSYVRKETGAYEYNRKLGFRETIAGLFPCGDMQQLDDSYTEITTKYLRLTSLTVSLLNEISDWLLQASKLFTFNKQKYHDSAKNIKNLLEEQKELFKEGLENMNLHNEYALHAYCCVHFARRVRKLARWCNMVCEVRSKRLLLLPFRHYEVNTHLIEDNDVEYDGFHSSLNEALDRTYTSFKPVNRVQVRDPDSSPPRVFVHLIGQFIRRVYNMIYDPVVLFCVKRAALTTVTLTPYFCRTTSKLAYQHWFLWVAVLTSYTVARKAVDGAYGLLAKFVYNFLGCLLGMVGWYISSGHGKGNPYGYAAVTAFVWLYICFQRQFNDHFAPSTSIVFSCTTVLVLGNSWNSGHMVLPGVDLGRGFKVAWIRFVTVSIGITISFIGTIFPHAYTAKKAVRELIGTCIEHIGDLKSSISNFAVQRKQNSSVHIATDADVITKSARAIITNASSAETLRKRLVYEPPLAGFYPTHRYKVLINYVEELTQLMSLLYTFLDEVGDASEMSKLLNLMGWTNPRLGDSAYSLLYMSSRAIADGKALPSVTSGYLAELYFCDTLSKNLEYIRNCKEPAVIVSVILSMQIYKRIDGVIILIKELVGEVYNLNMSLYEIQWYDEP